MDSSIYLVEIAQFQDLILQKQKFYFTQPSGIFLLATCQHARSGEQTGYNLPVLSHKIQLLAHAHFPI